MCEHRGQTQTKVRAGNVLDAAVLISNEDYLRRFLENICDFDMRKKIEQSDAK